MHNILLSPSLTFVFALLFLICGVEKGVSQDGSRLFPTQTVVYDQMPQSLRMQSADAIGDTTLVVWSTVKITSENDTLALLYGQFVEGGNVEGNPFLIHSNNARPRDHVEVVAVNDAFAVFWNDYRETNLPLVYSQRVSFDGAVGIEKRVDSLLIGASGIQRYGNPTQGRIVRWGETSTVVVEVNSQGELREERYAIPSKVLQQHYGVAGGERTLLVFGNGENLVLDEGSARVVEDAIPDERFFYPYYLRDDGRLSLVKEKSIYLYTSTFDSIANSSFPIPDYDSAVPGGTFVYQESEGEVVVVFTSLHDPIKPSDRWGASLRFKMFELMVVRVRLSVMGELIAKDTLYQRYEMQGFTTFDSRYFSDYALFKTEVKTICPNTYLLKHIVRYNFYSTALAVRDEESFTPTCFQVSLPDVVIIPCDPFQPTTELNCPQEIPLFESRLTLSRVTATYQSQVQLHTGMDSVILTVMSDMSPVPDTLDRTTYRLLPSILLRNGKLLLVYNTKQSQVYLYQHDPQQRGFFFLGETSSGLLTLSERPQLSWYPYMKDYHLYTRSGGSQTRLRNTNLTATVGMLTRSDEYRRSDVRTYEGWYDTLFSYRTFINLPTPNGWVVPVSNVIFPSVVGLETPSFEKETAYMLREPNTKVSLYHLRHPRFGVRNIFVDDAGRFLRSLDNPGPRHPSFPLVLIDSTTYLGLHQNTLYRVSDTGATALDTNRTGLKAEYQYTRLLGDHFLALRYLTDTNVLVQYYSTDGRLIRNQPQTILRKNLVSLHQNPVDSSIVLLNAVPEGIRGTFFRKDLRLLVRDSLLVRSATLHDYSAVFVDDTLILLWEDSRDGVSDLYWNRMWLPAPPATDSSTLAVSAIKEPGNDILKVLGLFPQPASEEATLVVECLRDVEGRISIYNGMGQEVQRSAVEEFLAGRSITTLDLHNLPSGIYTLLLKTDSAEKVIRFTVLH